MNPLSGLLRYLALGLLLLTLAGCEETRFESPLGDNIETCDTRWKGLWLNPKGDDREAEGLFVDAECRLLVITQPEKGGPLKPVHVPLNFVHAGGKDYVVVADDQLKGLVDLDPPPAVTPKPARSYFFARYRLRGDRLEIYYADTQRIAKLLIDDKLRGTLSKTPGTLHAYVMGDRATMLDIVRRLPVFADKPGAVLARSTQSLEDYERDLLRRQRHDRR